MAFKPKTKPAKKDKFADLDPDWKEAIEAASEDEINAKIAQVAKDQEALDQAKDDDEDLKNLKAQAKDAGQVYSDGRKANRLKTRYAIQLLHLRGKE